MESEEGERFLPVVPGFFRYGAPSESGRTGAHSSLKSGMVLGRRFFFQKRQAFKGRLRPQVPEPILPFRWLVDDFS